MITPALLVLACGSLLATALVRIGRIVDRIRAFSSAAESADDLARYERRASLAERAIVAFFAAVVTIVAACIALDRVVAGIGWIPVALTLVGMALITFGAAAMAAESRLASLQLRAEISALRSREA